MGQKIRVELSHGGGRTAKYAGEPGACFRCGQQGHWARYVQLSCFLANYLLIFDFTTENALTKQGMTRQFPLLSLQS